MGVKRIEAGLYAIDAVVRVGARMARKRERLRGTKAQAHNRWLDLKRELQSGNSSSSLTSPTLSNLGDLLKLYRSKREHSKYHLQKVGYLERELGQVALCEVPDRFETFVQVHRSTPSKQTGRLRSPAATNRLIEIVRAAFNLAVALGLLGENPITKARFPRQREIPRDVTLTEEDRRRLLNTVAREAPELDAIIRFALQVPCRKSELLNMRRDAVDLFSNAVRVRCGTTKNDAGVWKPIPPDLVDHFRNLPKGTEYVFYRLNKDGRPERLRNFRRRWLHVLDVAGLRGLRFHDSRHMSATDMVNNGTPKQVVMQVAGWRTNMLRNYYHRDPAAALRLVRFRSPAMPLRDGHDTTAGTGTNGQVSTDVSTKRLQRGRNRE